MYLNMKKASSINMNNTYLTAHTHTHTHIYGRTVYTHLIVDPVEESGYGGKKSWFESLHVLNEQLDISLEEPHLGSTHEHHCLARTKFRSVHCHAQHNTAYCIYQIARMRKLLASFWRSDDNVTCIIDRMLCKESN